MSNTLKQAVPPDAAAIAGNMADLFYAASKKIDDFERNSNPPVSAQDQQLLDDKSDKLDDLGDDYTAQSISDIVAGIQTDLTNIAKVTDQATQQLANLKEVGEIISVATSLVGLGTAIAARNAGGIITAVQTLGDLLTGTSSGASSTATDSD